MTLHEHDRDLVMALAEGSLDAGAQARAREDIAQCAECAEELALQVEALDMLGSASPVAMTGPESSQLHLALDAALTHQRVTAVQAPVKQRRFNWAPVFSVAAVLLVLVLVAPNLNLLGSDDSDSSSDEIAVALDTPQKESSTSDDASPDASSFTTNELRLPEDTAAGGAAEPTPPSAVADEPTEGGDDGNLGDAVTTTAAAASEEAPDYEDALSEVEDLVDDGTPPAEARTTVARDWPLAFDSAEDADDTCVSEGITHVSEIDDTPPVSSYLLGDIVLAEGDNPVSLTVHAVVPETVVLAHEPVSCAVLGSSPLP